MIRAPLAVVSLVLIYSLIIGIILITLSSISLLSYSCAFDFHNDPVSYMMYLKYYRAARCYDNVQWEALDGINEPIAMQPVMPSESHAVLLTLVLSIVYLVLNIALVATSILAFNGIRRKGKSKQITFLLYFAPFLTVFVTIVVLDVVASGFYLVDYFKCLSVNGLMSLLEIRNQDEIRPILEQVSVTNRSISSIIFFGGTSKSVLLLILNCVIVYLFTPAAWEICKQNQLVKVEPPVKIAPVKTIHRTLSRVSTPPIVEVSRVEPTTETPTTIQETNRDDLTTPKFEMVPPRYENQLPYNPYVTEKTPL